MAVVVEGFRHRTGEHCASTALRNVLAHAGLELSEPMVFGLGSWLGFFSIRHDEASPTAMFHGRVAGIEGFFENTGMPFVDRVDDDDARSWRDVRVRLDAGEPVMISTDTFYLGYHKTTSHFPGHRCVVVGYDDDAGTALIADRKYDELQVCTQAELARARNAPDYAISCRNEWGDFLGERRLGVRLEEAIRRALERNARWMLSDEPHDGLDSGIRAMRKLAGELPGWKELDDWSWAARFGYQVVIKRGAGGSFFRSIYADFLEESRATLPGLVPPEWPARMHDIAAAWRGLAAVLREQSEREHCDPALFARAGERMGELADAEESFFRDVLARLEAAG